MIHRRFAQIVCGFYALLLAPLFLPAQEEWSKEILLGTFSPSAHSRFVKVDNEYASRPGMYLHKDAYRAFQAMYHTAESEGIELKIVSALRTFYHQQNVWDKKWTSSQFKHFPAKERALEIMKYTAMPGASRHHWGTEVDLNNMTNEYFSEGEGKRVYEWLSAHAAEFGFYQPYSSKEGGRTGYDEEKWHWSYFPLSRAILNLYLEKVKYPDLSGFAGSGYADELSVFNTYVKGVSNVE